jgi:hypothetical protein
MPTLFSIRITNIKSGYTFNHIKRVLSKHNIGSVGFLPIEATSFLCSVKDDFSLKTPGICNIPCKCGSILDKQGLPLRPGSTSIIIILVLIIQRNQLWLSTAQTWIMVSSFMILVSCPRNLDIWNVLLREWQRMSSTLTAWTRLVSP